MEPVPFAVLTATLVVVIAGALLLLVAETILARWGRGAKEREDARRQAARKAATTIVRPGFRSKRKTRHDHRDTPSTPHGHRRSYAPGGIRP